MDQGTNSAAERQKPMNDTKRLWIATSPSSGDRVRLQPQAQCFEFCAASPTHIFFSSVPGLIAASKEVILEVILFISITLRRSNVSSPAVTFGGRR